VAAVENGFMMTADSVARLFRDVNYKYEGPGDFVAPGPDWSTDHFKIGCGHGNRIRLRVVMSHLPHQSAYPQWHDSAGQ
jgi:hypothetical protein